MSPTPNPTPQGAIGANEQEEQCPIVTKARRRTVGEWKASVFLWGLSLPFLLAASGCLAEYEGEEIGHIELAAVDDNDLGDLPPGAEPEPGSGGVAPEPGIGPEVLKGYVSTSYGRDYNRCLPDPVGAVMSLRDHGDILGFHMGWDNYPSLDGDKWHWQGIQRLPPLPGKENFMVVTSSHPTDVGSWMGTVQMKTRGKDGLRFRGNRMSRSNQDWDISPSTLDGILMQRRINTVYNHPGGIQALGEYLLVPLERYDYKWSGGYHPDGYTGRVYLYDMDPEPGEGDSDYPYKRWGFVVSSKGAGTVSAAKLADGRYLMITSTEGLSKLEFNVSNLDSNGVPLDITNPNLFGDWNCPNCEGGFQALWNTNSTVWHGGYNSLHLVTACEDGQLYLIGGTKNGSTDYIDIYKLNLTLRRAEGPGRPLLRNKAGEQTYNVSITLQARRHVSCSSSALDYGRQCDLKAAGGPYIDPDGRLYYYAIPYTDDGPGGSVRMMEFRPQDHLYNPDTGTTSCDSLDDAWVELYNGPLDSNDEPTNLDSLMIDFADRTRRDLSNFGTAYNFHDKTRSMRYCIPQGFGFKLWSDPDYQGNTTALVTGSGQPEAKKWGSTQPWSSGCFFDLSTNTCISPL